jgi:murein DD-endopeptidase MepM/ murein hydrolase activator NlpD
MLAASTLAAGATRETVMEKARRLSGQVFEKSTAAAVATAKRMQQYLAKKKLLATFHDAGDHSEEAVLKMLRKTRIVKTTPKVAPKVAPKPGVASPPAGGTSPAPAGAVASVVATVPEHFDGKLVWPVEAGIFSSEFGRRSGRPHKGIDIAADVGEPVHAIAEGEVIYAGSGLSGYGNVVIVQHDGSLSSLYAHNSVLKVKNGDHVKQGQLISLLGNTGRSTGPHVHFEIRRGDLAVNPRTLLPMPDFG